MRRSEGGIGKTHQSVLVKNLWRHRSAQLHCHRVQGVTLVRLHRNTALLGRRLLLAAGQRRLRRSNLVDRVRVPTVLGSSEVEERVAKVLLVHVALRETCSA